MKKSKVLLIEDSEKDFCMIKKWLESLGYHVLPIDFHEMASALYDENADIKEYIIRQINENYEHIAFIFCDIKLHGEDRSSKSIVNTIRSHKGMNSLFGLMVPIYILSDYEFYNNEQARKIGADLVIYKREMMEEKTDLVSIIKHSITTETGLKGHGELVETSLGDINKQNDEINLKQIEERPKVFIVDGHSKLLAETKIIIMNLNFEPVILQELANGGLTQIEKIEENSKVAYAIVIYTGEDKGGENKENAELRPRALQNVVFEHGFLNARIGRKNVCALVENKVEKPSDLDGVICIPIDKNGAWKMRVAEEMKAAGLKVDKNDITI